MWRSPACELLLLAPLLLLLCAALPHTAAATAATAPLPARYPDFSWDTVQTFIHGCQCDSVLLTPQQLAYVSRYT